MLEAREGNGLPILVWERAENGEEPMYHCLREKDDLAHITACGERLAGDVKTINRFQAAISAYCKLCPTCFPKHKSCYPAH